MIKRFDEFIEEGFLSKTLGRAKSDTNRLEDGNGVMTDFGEKITVKSIEFDYEEFINDLIEGSYEEDDLYSIYYLHDSKPTSGLGGFEYYIGTTVDDEHVTICFPDYSDIEDDYEEDISEDDYRRICEVIANAIKNVKCLGLMTRDESSFAEFAIVSYNDMDEIGEGEGYSKFRKMLCNDFNNKECHISHGHDLGAWDEMRIKLNYWSILNGSKLYDNAQECVSKFFEEENEDDDYEEDE